jgi:hypothetical protein
VAARLLRRSVRRSGRDEEVDRLSSLVPGLVVLPTPTQ